MNYIMNELKREPKMKDGPVSIDLMRERLMALRFVEPENDLDSRRVKGEIKYLESILQAEEFSSNN